MFLLKDLNLTRTGEDNNTCNKVFSFVTIKLKYYFRS